VPRGRDSPVARNRPIDNLHCLVRIILKLPQPRVELIRDNLILEGPFVRAL